MAQYSIGKTLKLYRKVRGLSQEQLSLDSKIDRRYISDLENDRRNPSVGVLERLSDYMDVSLSSLLRVAESLEAGVSTLEALKATLVELGHDDTVVLENPDYADCVVGIDAEGRVIYSYERMVDHLIIADGMTRDEAMEFIDYNTVRALDYMGEKAPVICYPIDI